MNKELIKKAYEHYNGVWPFIDKVNMLAKRNYDTKEFYPTALSFDGFHHFSRKWQWVGTKADFDAYGESLKVLEDDGIKSLYWVAKVDSYGTPWNHDGPHDSYDDALNSVPMLESINKSDKFIVTEQRFRPIKSESEKQADEMFDIVKDATDTYHACELLVQGGYKKC
jgi:hypothetical protein